MKYAAIFDWDGVVINSEREHEMSWELLARAHGFTLPDNFIRDTFGKRNVEIIPNILRWTSDPAETLSMSVEKEVYYREIVARQGVPEIAGVEKFLRELRAEGVPCAVGTSTGADNLQVAVKMLNLGGIFDAFATSDDVSRGKPAPDVFLCAARKLAFKPENCCVFEDSTAGIDAAIAAGMRRVALATTHPREFWLERERKDPTRRVDAIIPDFREFGAKDFFAVFSNGL